MTNGHYDFESGELCLDFINTKDWRAGEHPVEALGDYDDLVVWGEAAGIVSPDRADSLRDLAYQRPVEAEQTYEQAILLREAIYRIFSDHYRRGSVHPADLQVLNTALGNSLTHLRVSLGLDGFNWEWSQESEALGQVVWPIARSAADLLTSDRLERVRECEDDRGCGYLFVDTSRNRSRRWCSMDSCGNRAKAKRHYDRVNKSREDADIHLSEFS